MLKTLLILTNQLNIVAGRCAIIYINIIIDALFYYEIQLTAAVDLLLHAPMTR